ncbi:hypothetical protein Dvina_25380 [Dactylosporangium vinaceum]|uniref:Right handed beta helix domain-containing protein n=1 Tax=Dactylosporangium vinaceum TaxID=53362 RepID=A0ABV5MDQ9_9ACTN|nr:hypothetical protein [Dactylosporangium vinaceum]UAC01091.1 hypothetical protein Dvina_25380 [Dactylosporangium vinaceum]
MRWKLAFGALALIVVVAGGYFAFRPGPAARPAAADQSAGSSGSVAAPGPAPADPGGRAGMGAASASASPAAVCGTKANVPGGRDPAGGCFPGPDNTGVPAGVTLTRYTGPCSITKAGTVISAKQVTCDLEIRAANVTIEKSRVDGTVNGAGVAFTITDSVINASPDGIRQTTGVGESNFTLRRVEVLGGNRGVYCASNCTIADSWVHGQRIKDDWHASAVRMGERTTVTHSSIVCDAPIQPDPEGSCSGSLTGYGDFGPIRDNTIRGNLFMATPTAAYCAYGGSTKGKPYSGQTARIVFDNNVFQKGTGSVSCAIYGPVGDWDPAAPGGVWANNRFDNGTVIPNKAS